MRTLPLLALLACTSSTPSGDDAPQDGPADTDAPVDETDVAPDTDPPAPTGDTGPTLPTFTEGRYRARLIEVVELPGGLDIDGDSTIDNALPTLLPLVDAALPEWDLSLGTVNQRLADMLLFERVLVLFDARTVQATMALSVHEGARNAQGDIVALASSWDEQGQPVQRLEGPWIDADTFTVGPDALVVPLQLAEGEPILYLHAAGAWMRGGADDQGLEGFIAAAVTVDQVVDDLVLPLIETSVPPAEQADVLDTVRQFLTLAADLRVDDQPAISAAFRLEALPSTWLDR